MNFPKSMGDSESVLCKTVTVGIKYRHSQVAVQTRTCYGGNKSVAEMSSPTESGGLTRLCRKIHPKFSSPYISRKRKAFCSKQTSPDRDCKSSAGCSKHPQYDSNHSSPLLSSSGSSSKPTALPWISLSRLPVSRMEHRCRSFLRNCSPGADGQNPNAAPTAPHKASSHVKTRLLLHMQKAIMLKTHGEPCEVQIKSQRHGRQEKRPIKFTALFSA